MEVNSKDDDLNDPLNALLAEDVQPLPPTAPDGGFIPTLPIMPEPLPPATPENMICLRGPCSYYMEVKTRFQAGNTKGTLDHEPTQVNRFCRAISGTEIDLTDELVKDCSEWDPLVATDLLMRKVRRDKWLEENEKEEG